SSSKQDDLSMSLPSPKVKVSQVPLNATISVAQALRTVRRRTTVNQVLLVAPPRQAAFSKVKNCPAVWAMSKLPPRTSLCTASMQRTTCCSLKVQYLSPWPRCVGSRCSEGSLTTWLSKKYRWICQLNSLMSKPTLLWCTRLSTRNLLLRARGLTRQKLARKFLAVDVSRFGNNVPAGLVKVLSVHRR